jgi:hypothetical protein
MDVEVRVCKPLGIGATIKKIKIPVNRILEE